MSLALRRLADDVGVNERTLRRAVGDGLIRAQRPSSRQLLLSDREAEWVRLHWPLVAQLRSALRTEPNLELAVLFGSAARGDDVAGTSDVDLLVGLRRSYPGALEALRVRLNGQLAAQVQIVPVHAARRNQRLLVEILRDGRPLVDRERSWPHMQAQASQTRAQAAQLGDESREGARAALGYFQELAATRARAPLGAG